MDVYFFLTLLYSISVVVVGFFCTAGAQYSQMNMALKIRKAGKPVTREQADFLALVGFLITTFMPVLNTSILIVVMIKIAKAVKKHYE